MKTSRLCSYLHIFRPFYMQITELYMQKTARGFRAVCFDRFDFFEIDHGIGMSDMLPFHRSL